MGSGEDTSESRAGEVYSLSHMWFADDNLVSMYRLEEREGCARVCVCVCFGVGVLLWVVVYAPSGPGASFSETPFF